MIMQSEIDEHIMLCILVKLCFILLKNKYNLTKTLFIYIITFIEINARNQILVEL